MADQSQQRPKPSGSGRSSGARRRKRRSGGSSTPAKASSASKGSSPRSPSRPNPGRQGSRPANSPGTPRAVATQSPPPPADRAPALPVDPEARRLAHAVAANRRRAWAVACVPAVVLFVVVAGVGTALSAALAGLIAGAVIAVVLAVGLWRGSARMLLGTLGARPVDEDDVPGPATLVDGLCATMGLPMPELSVVDDAFPDAIAVGRGPGDATLVLTTGLLSALDPVALEGVLAHELAHVKRHDTAPATLAAALVLAVGMGGSGAALVHRLAGRGREFEADRYAVRTTRYPPGLSMALRTMSDVAGSGAPTSLCGRRGAQVARWLFTVALPERSGRRPEEDRPTGQLDAPSVRIAALDEW